MPLTGLENNHDYEGHQKIGEVSHSTEVQVKAELDTQCKFKMHLPPGCPNESTQNDDSWF